MPRCRGWPRRESGRWRWRAPGGRFGGPGSGGQRFGGPGSGQQSFGGPGSGQRRIGGPGSGGQRPRRFRGHRFRATGSTSVGPNWPGAGASQPPFPPAPRPATEPSLPDAGLPERGPFPRAIKPPTDPGAAGTAAWGAGTIGARPSGGGPAGPALPQRDRPANGPGPARAVSQAWVPRSPRQSIPAQRSPAQRSPRKAVRGQRRVSHPGRSPTPSLPCRPPEPALRRPNGGPAARPAQQPARREHGGRRPGGQYREFPCRGPRRGPAALPPVKRGRQHRELPGHAVAYRLGRRVPLVPASAGNRQPAAHGRPGLTRRRRVSHQAAPGWVICPPPVGLSAEPGLPPGQAFSGPAQLPVWPFPPCAPTHTSARTPARTGRR